MTEFTQADLLRYFYGETSESKTAEIRAALQKDSKLRDSYNQLKLTLNALDEAKSSPSQSVMDKILKYAASKQPKVQTH